LWSRAASRKVGCIRGVILPKPTGSNKGGVTLKWIRKWHNPRQKHGLSSHLPAMDGSEVEGFPVAPRGGSALATLGELTCSWPANAHLSQVSGLPQVLGQIDYHLRSCLERRRILTLEHCGHRPCPPNRRTASVTLMPALRLGGPNLQAPGAPIN
jgi:hypothetical protein